MEQERNSSVILLLRQANEFGMRLEARGNSLAVLSPEGRAADAGLLAKLKANKSALLDYLTHSQPRRQDVCSASLILEGREYWKVTPFHYYWLNDLYQEFKEKRLVNTIYRITGPFCAGNLQKAFRFLVERHESLRASFTRIEKCYCMTVGAVEDPGYEAEYREWVSQVEDGDGMDDYIHFRDHVFDLVRGPLIRMRIAKTGDDDYLVAIKIHHVIYDAWSFDVMARDLFSAYIALDRGEMPGLPPLPFQYKEYMCMRNRSIDEAYGVQDAYWRSRFPRLPGRLEIPGARAVKGSGLCRPGKVLDYRIPGALLPRLKALCLLENVSFFVVLMAAFKLYLYRSTGQPDILVGTMCFGRDSMEGLADQIGYYAYTDLIRTVLDDSDDLVSAIRKVRESNEAMKAHDVCTLMEHTQRMVPEDQDLTNAGFWRINLHYADRSGFYYEPGSRQAIPSTIADIRVEPLDQQNQVLETDLDLKIYFFHLKDSIDMTIHYDCEMFDEAAIGRLIRRFHHFLDTTPQA